MPHYITLMRWTDKGVQGVKESPQRIRELVKAIERLGGKVQTFYTMGEYDFVAVAEAPSDDIVMQAALLVNRAGNARTVTMKAWTLEEAEKVIAKLPWTRRHRETEAPGWSSNRAPSTGGLSRRPRRAASAAVR